MPTLYQLKNELKRLKKALARKDEFILQLAERIYICSGLLGRCAERKTRQCWKRDRTLGRECDERKRR